MLSLCNISWGPSGQQNSNQYFTLSLFMSMLTFLKEIAENIPKDCPKSKEQKTKRTKRREKRRRKRTRARKIDQRKRMLRKFGFHSRLYSCDESCEAENTL